MLNLAGYEECDLVYTGSRTLVYRGVRTSDRYPVIVKVLRYPNPSIQELVQFRNQYFITRELQHPHIVQPLSLEPYGNGYGVIMPDSGAIALSEYGQLHPLSLPEILDAIGQLTEALHYLSQQRIIHKDIKPANIIIHPQTHQIQLIDFSISSLLPKEEQQLVSPNVLEGSLSYLSPEQTGRMNRGIDYRTDFYSLGVTLYELLVGQQPFQGEDPMELVHCHIAQIPEFPTDRDIPQVLQEIVLKLMAKNAEERYQSALGLKHDLECCGRQWQETGKIIPFALGMRDYSYRLQIPQKLYGRDRELATLLTAFDRVASGAEAPGESAEMVLVSGYSGIGKSALVRSLYKPITEKRGYFIAGKFDQFQRNIPYSALVDAFAGLVKQLLGESDEYLEQWKHSLLQTLGNNGQVIVDVIPDLERIIGSQPPIPQLGAAEAQNRFNLVFQRFVQVFCRPEHPLVIFLDDMQWADSATLNLLEILLEGCKIQYLLPILAYRDNEVFPGHPFGLTLAKLERQQVRVEAISLTPLSQEEVAAFIGDTLDREPDEVTDLGQLIIHKTAGNPFFVNQFLKTLYNEELLEFNRDRQTWQWNLEDIETMRFSDNVVELMVGQLQKLPEPVQTILAAAAYLGTEFDLNTLSWVRKQDSKDVFKQLQIPLENEFILVQSALDKDLLIQAYKFAHDRIQQAAYALVPEDKRDRTHYQIGKRLLEHIPAEAWGDRIFQLVNQLNYGTRLITETNERDELARLNLIASRKAKGTNAYETAIEYVKTGLFLLGETAWNEQYDMTLEFHELGAEMTFLSGDFQSMKSFIDSTIQQVHSLPEQVNVYCIKFQYYNTQAQGRQAIAVALEFLQQFGITFPETPTPEDTDKIVAEIKASIGERTIADLVDLPLMSDREQIAIIEVINSIIPAAYLSGSLLYPLFVALGVKLSIQYGNTSASPHIYSCYGIVSCSLLSDIDTGVKFGRLSLEVVSKLKMKAIEPLALHVVMFFLVHRQSHIQETIAPSRDGYRIGLEVGTLEFAGYNAHAVCFQSFWCSQPLVSLEEDARTYYHGLIQINQLAASDWCRSCWQCILNLLGQGISPTILAETKAEEEQFISAMGSANNSLGLSVFYLYKMMLCYLFGELESALDSAEKVRNYLQTSPGLIAEPVLYLYDSLIRLNQLGESSLELDKTLEEVEENQIRLQRYWADYAPMNHQHKVDLIVAERHRVLGEKVDALEAYDRAIAKAKEYGFLQEAALGNELAARFSLDWGKDKMAAGYMQDAYYGYAQWGANAKCDRLKQNYPELLSAIADTSSPANQNETFSKTSTDSSNLLDLKTVMKASQVISEEISLEALLSKLMHISIENAGANEGLLILNNTGNWEVTAQYANGTCNLVTTRLDRATNLPKTIINTVKHTRETLLIDNLEEEHPFATDSYLQQHPPKSLFCTPILNQGQLIGILYLENYLAANAFTPDRIEVLSLLTTQAAISINNARFYHTLEDKVAQRTSKLATANAEIAKLNERLKAENLRLGAELDIARRVQEMILPKAEELLAIPSLDIAGYMAPADEVGGDYYDVLVKDEVVTIGIGDVTGHGLESGLVMMMAQTVIRAMKELQEEDPVRFLNTVNSTLYKNVERMQVDRQLTLAILNYNQGYLSISGQHEEVLVVRADGSLETIDTMDLGMTIGLIDDIAEFIAQVTVKLEPGDGVVLYTDGIPEAQNKAGKMYGLEQLCEVIQRHWSLSAEGIQAAVISDVQRFIGDGKVFDDITLLVLKERVVA
ncbi:AAA family ATPase [Roseofilum casamattae]|uniref:AAA family ATPase n=1 Tax=Roseofilum casamattae BLCC-M143 TaxID=3022442 RepID=A0ABT7BZP9_9CYAN|nr:AAA family ATPase [Roseofilum casamattae]MDJ1184676.1 AAA family ATPase [Roseofilum casamattae BLCC-M143]